MTIINQNRAFEKLCERLGCEPRREHNGKIVNVINKNDVINQSGISVWMRVDGIFIGVCAPPNMYGVLPLHHHSPNFRRHSEHLFTVRLQWWKEAIQWISRQDDSFLIVTRLTIIVAMIEELVAEENLQSARASAQQLSPCGCATKHTANA